MLTRCNQASSEGEDSRKVQGWGSSVSKICTELLAIPKPDPPQLGGHQGHTTQGQLWQLEVHGICGWWLGRIYALHCQNLHRDASLRLDPLKHSGHRGTVYRGSGWAGGCNSSVNKNCDEPRDEASRLGMGKSSGELVGRVHC